LKERREPPGLSTASRSYLGPKTLTEEGGHALYASKICLCPGLVCFRLPVEYQYHRLTEIARIWRGYIIRARFLDDVSGLSENPEPNDLGSFLPEALLSDKSLGDMLLGQPSTVGPSNGCLFGLF
jgi:6-phosphogluconate dehydrogenase